MYQYILKFIVIFRLPEFLIIIFFFCFLKIRSLLYLSLSYFKKFQKISKSVSSVQNLQNSHTKWTRYFWNIFFSFFAKKSCIIEFQSDHTSLFETKIQEITVSSFLQKLFSSCISIRPYVKSYPLLETLPYFRFHRVW